MAYDRGDYDVELNAQTKQILFAYLDGRLAKAAQKKAAKKPADT